MRTNRFVTRLGLVALTALAFGACAPDGAPSAPSLSADAPRAALLGTESGATKLGRMDVTGVRRSRPLLDDVTVQQTIGPRGGRLQLPQAGFTLDVPAGAVAAPTAFTVTALAGDLLAYEFGPSGSSFAIPLAATQDLSATNVKRLPKQASLRLGYFVEPTDVNTMMGTATVAQETPGTLTAGGRSATFPIPHFSGWIIHWRLDGTADSSWTP